jgi:hypothetical protein
MYVRPAPMAKVDHVALDEVGAEIIREVARRILADETGKITIGTEAVRLTREGIPSPGDRRAQLYGRPVKGGPWTGHTLKHILCSEAALGYLMHGGRPVLGADGRPVRLAEPLWDRATHDALVTATAPRRDGTRAPKGMRLLTGTAFCGNCGARLHVTGRGHSRYAYECTARIRGIRASAQCRPAPAMALTAADALVSGWFLARYGSGEVMRKIYDPGTGHAAQIAELEATRTRLREDRHAGLYDSAEDAEWYRTEYRRLGEEITALTALPERKPVLAPSLRRCNSFAFRARSGRAHLYNPNHDRRRPAARRQTSLDVEGPERGRRVPGFSTGVQTDILVSSQSFRVLRRRGGAAARQPGQSARPRIRTAPRIRFAGLARSRRTASRPPRWSRRRWTAGKARTP